MKRSVERAIQMPAFLFCAGLRSRLVDRSESSLAGLGLSIEHSLCARRQRGHKRGPFEAESEIALWLCFAADVAPPPSPSMPTTLPLQTSNSPRSPRRPQGCGCACARAQSHSWFIVKATRAARWLAEKAFECVKRSKPSLLFSLLAFFGCCCVWCCSFSLFFVIFYFYIFSPSFTLPRPVRSSRPATAAAQEGEE